LSVNIARLNIRGAVSIRIKKYIRGNGYCWKPPYLRKRNLGKDLLFLTRYARSQIEITVIF
jgi:hypothetical protein